MRILSILCLLGWLAMTSSAAARPSKKQWAAAEAVLRDHCKAQNRGILEVGDSLQKTLGTALKKVYDSSDYKEFMAKQGYGTVWADSEGTAKFMAASDANLGAALKAVGLAKEGRPHDLREIE